MTPSFELAGDRMKITTDADGGFTVTFDDKGTGRVCGTCTLCCKLLPVPVFPLNKAAGQKCKHSSAGRGCTIYPRRPNACKTWACRWLSDPEAAGLQRPDRVHYVIDMEVDYVTITGERGTQKIDVIQVWVDPAFPDAHKDPKLREFMAMMGEKHGYATIVRWSSRRAMTVFPPAMSEDGKWHEVRDGQVVARTDQERAIMQKAVRVEMSQ
jgi:hypothetical protein